ncbi:MAG: hypothetical protein ACI4OR_00630 [Alphaproteobacteria bacterium]
MKKNQAGRTLIETLAIIAVIGILSISGLQLYAKAMNTIRANYLMQQIFIKANELIQNPVAQRRRMVDISMLDERNGRLAYGYEIDLDETLLNQNQRTITVKVNGYFPAGLCRILKKKIKTQEYAGLQNIRADNVDLAPEFHADCPTDSDITSMTFIIDSEFRSR